MKNTQHIWQAISKTAKKKFKSATIMFLLIMLVVNVFPILFGPEHMVLGIIIAPLMLALRDMTAHPVMHFFRQALILCFMASAACFSMLVPVPAALLIHLSVAFFLLYTYTCECGDHMYFLYILSYLFLIFIGPITLQQLPLRLLGMVTGAGFLILYQYITGRGRVAAVSRSVLLSLLEDTKSRIGFLLCGDEPPHDDAKLSNTLKMFSQTMEYRRKTTLGLSDASIAMVAAVLSLEKFNSSLRCPDFVPTKETFMLLRSMLPWLDHIQAFVLQERDDIPQIQRETLGEESSDAEQFYQWTEHLNAALLTMLCPEKSRIFRKTGVSLWNRLKIAINFSPLRAAYALRLSCLLSAGIVLVQHFHLDHGKWLLFTIASVSLPYSDEVGPKAKKRFWATLIGGAASLIVFSLIPSQTGRMVAMLVSGYLSCYMTDYLYNFSCGTFGALGGAAVAVAATGFGPVGYLVLVRIGYIAAGIIIAITFNCWVFPLNRKKATRHLAQKYIQVTQAVSESYQNHQPDLQLHYHLLLRLQRLEGKLRQNANILHQEDIQPFLLSCHMDIRQARKAPSIFYY